MDSMNKHYMHRLMSVIKLIVNRDHQLYFRKNEKCVWGLVFALSHIQSKDNLDIQFQTYTNSQYRQIIIAENVLAGNQRGGPVKVSVVGGGQGGTKVWRRERIEMTEADLDDVAFLSGS